MFITRIRRATTIITFLVCCIALFIALGLPTVGANAEQLGVNEGYISEDLIVGDSMNANNKYGYYETESQVRSQMADNIKDYLENHKNASRASISLPSYSITGRVSFSAPNHSQTTLNNQYKERHDGREISGTCSIVALTSMFEGLNRICDEEYCYEQETYDRFETLLNISMSKGNTYDKGEADIGTSTQRLDDILIDYLNMIYPGFSVDFYRHGSHYSNHINSYSSIADADINYIRPFSILSMYNYNKTKRHAVLIVGLEEYTVNYKYKTKSGWNALFAKTGSIKFVVFKVCNGWNDNDSNTVGTNYKYLVMDYDIPFNITTFNWDDMVWWLDF